MKKFVVIALAALLLTAGGFVGLLSLRQPSSAADADLATPASATRTSVVAESNVVPIRSAVLSLASGGIVAEVRAAEGSTVSAGELVARLDSDAQQARLARAEAQLDNAEAQLKRLLEGAQPEEIEAALAQLTQAEAQLQQSQSSVSVEDITAAEAQIQHARQQLLRLQAGPKQAQVQQAQAQLAQAEAALAGRRDQLSANKTQAELRLQQATQQLVQAQTSYSTARWNWEHVQEEGTDPVIPTVLDPTRPGQTRGNRLNDAQKQLYQDAYVRAEAALRAAEQTVREAQVAYDTARAGEVDGVQQAEQQLRAAEAALTQVETSVEPDQITGAQAQLANARAVLTRLTGQNRKDTLATATASVDAAQARLNQLLAPPRESEVAAAQAQVEIARADVEAARAAVADTELRAPFAGTVVHNDMKAGEYLPPGAPAAHFADTSAWEIETSDLTELSVVRVQVGDPVTITFDALPGLTLGGRVTAIERFGQSQQGDITYQVMITPDQPDARLQWNMTAAVSIEPR